jgi:hypothetical protein
MMASMREDLQRLHNGRGSVGAFPNNVACEHIHLVLALWRQKPRRDTQGDDDGEADPDRVARRVRRRVREA